MSWCKWIDTLFYLTNEWGDVTMNEEEQKTIQQVIARVVALDIIISSLKEQFPEYEISYTPKK